MASNSNSSSSICSSGVTSPSRRGALSPANWREFPLNSCDSCPASASLSASAAAEPCGTCWGAIPPVGSSPAPARGTTSSVGGSPAGSPASASCPATSPVRGSPAGPPASLSSGATSPERSSPAALSVDPGSCTTSSGRGGPAGALLRLPLPLGLPTRLLLLMYAYEYIREIQERESLPPPQNRILRKRFEPRLVAPLVAHKGPT